MTNLYNIFRGSAPGSHSFLRGIQYPPDPLECHGFPKYFTHGTPLIVLAVTLCLDNVSTILYSVFQNSPSTHPYLFPMAYAKRQMLFYRLAWPRTHRWFTCPIVIPNGTRSRECLRQTKTPKLAWQNIVGIKVIAFILRRCSQSKIKLRD